MIKQRRREFLTLASAAFALVLAAPAAAQQRVTINVMTAGDQNMVDYITDFLGPQFEKQNPNVRVRAVGTGPGEAGSQKIWERMDAQKKANAAAWDVDVGVVHQTMAGQMVREGSLTAMAFLFAIFTARPSPFYLMDEVEPALDDVNLHRFLRLIEGFASASQVLIVTHQKRTRRSPT